MNSELFDSLYFNKLFQKRLLLKVIDEAHMIYSWGLVASRKFKGLISHTRGADRACFRPSYGNLGARIMASDHVPVLLMSATCRPQAIDSIRTSLKLTQSNLKLLQGELVRPEIRLVRVPLKCSIKSNEDIRQFFAAKSLVPDESIPPTLIYSTSQHGTWNSMEQIMTARGTPHDKKKWA